MTRVVPREDILVYLCRYNRSQRGEFAQACEFLEVQPFNFPTNPRPEHSSFPSPSHGLNYFRMAQKIRNEHGLYREDSPPNCFETFEEIIRLERKIADDDPIDFLLQGIALNMLNEGPIQSIYDHLETHSQLEAFHDGVLRLRGEQIEMSAKGWYADRFVLLKKTTPTWRQVKIYLDATASCDLGEEILFGANMEDNDLDDALNSVSTHLVRAYHSLLEKLSTYPPEASIRLSNAVSRVLTLLMIRGADQQFRNHAGRSSTEIIAELEETNRRLLSQTDLARTETVHGTPEDLTPSNGLRQSASSLENL